jgi:DNA (cytosine-5)-methyltransferase 1
MASTTGSMHTGSPARPRVVEKRSQSRTLSTEPLRVFALSPSPMSRSSVTISKTGTSSAPIEFEENENEFLDKLVKPTRSLAATRYRNRDASYPLIPRGRRSERQAIISLDEDEDVTVESGLAGRRTDALARSMRRHPTKHDELIDLEDIESFEEIEEREIKELQRYDLEQQLLRVEDVYHEDHQTSRRRSSKAKAHVYRNPTIISPFYAVESYEYKNSTLKPKKTVELRDGDFLWIKHIILSRESNQVSLRGIRLQRVRDLNGMVEKKINEVCLFYEVDLDDSRKLEEQSAVEVPVADVVRIRILRTTNQTFPLCRNITLSDYRNKEEVAEEGGLTVRWKYTCTYATATDRHRNVYRERTLKHIRADEATEAFMITDNLRRHEWRGETIPGGAYQPAIKTKQICHMPEIRQLSHISIISDNSDPEICPVPTVHPRSPIRSESSHKSLTITASFPVKRKFSSSEDSIRLGKRDKSISGVRPKRIRYEDEKVESTRKRFSGIRLQIEKSDSRAVSVVIDLVSDEPTVSIPPSTPAMKSIKPSSLITPPESGSVRPISRPGRPPVILPSNNRDLTGQSPCPRPRLTMSLLSSELSNPPTTGSVQSNSAQTPTARSPGQTLTYGDAFCGAGGTTRGAAMAGLRVKWGFDFWEHACATWGANFPYATCYYLAAHQFVEVARQATRDEKQDIMKVDIVHLSPPCQYFSPAHTINGADDEMNIASLFAVQEVIEVARPRIVTLEQTFGIVSVRFRYYFAALIQMFTSHDFSVRWAIVPLAQWVSFSTLPIPG